MTNKSFHESIGPIITFGQFLAMLPVNGVLSKKENDLQFRWTSIKAIYAVIFLILGSAETSLATRRLYVIGFSIGYGEAYLFYLFSMVRAFMVFRLAIKWKCIMIYWREKEDVFLNYPYETQKWSLKFRLTLFFSVMTSCVFVEHIFFLAYAIHTNKLQIEHCNPKSKLFWDNFLSRYRPHVRHFVKYAPWQLPIYEWVNLLQAFAFNYTDIFIMLLSIGITFRFNQYNELFRKMVTTKHIQYPTALWEDLRVHYVQLMDLTRFIDSHISGIVLISSSHNMLTIVLKCYYAFKPVRIDPLDSMYFWFFMCLLLARTIAGCYLPSLINDAAFKPLNFIRLVPNRYWNVELKRLHDTILLEAPTLAFSGQRFFFLTKRTLLSMIGSIITFEIILLNQVESLPGGLCDTID